MMLGDPNLNMAVKDACLVLVSYSKVKIEKVTLPTTPAVRYR